MDALKNQIQSQLRRFDLQQLQNISLGLIVAGLAFSFLFGLYFIAYPLSIAGFGLSAYVCNQTRNKTWFWVSIGFMAFFVFLFLSLFV